MCKFLPFLLVAVALTARLVPGPRTIDDAYITLRDARNLLADVRFQQQYTLLRMISTDITEARGC